MTLSPGAAEVVLAFADDEHVIGQRLTEWIGVAPFLEEDLAISSIAQDELGHAAGLYELLIEAGRSEKAGSSVLLGLTQNADTVDSLAFRREAEEYRCCWFVEQPATEWAYTLVRHWLYDHAERFRWETMAYSSYTPLMALAIRALREEQYHRRHADVMFERLITDDEARPLIVDQLDRSLPLAVALFEPVAGEAAALADSVISESSQALRSMWWSDLSEQLQRLGLSRAMPNVHPQLQQGRTLRSKHFAQLHADINQVLAIAPNAHW